MVWEVVSSSCFKFVFGTQVRLQHSLSIQIFLQWVDLDKEYMKQDFEKIVKKVVDNLTWGRHVPTYSIKSGDNCANFGHNSGDGDYIELDKNNPIYLIGSYFSKSG